MAETLREEPPDFGASVDAAPEPAPEPSAPAAEPATAPASAPAAGDALDDILAEYDRQQEASLPQADSVAETRQADSTADREAVAQVHALYQNEAARQALVQDFEQYCARHQERLPDYAPQGYYRSEMIAMAAGDPRLEIALRAQHANVNQTAVRVELERVNGALVRAAHDPLADPQVIPSLQRMKFELEVAFHARTLLRQADAAIVKKANARPPVDPDLSADHMAVVQAVRSAGAPMRADPPPNLGQLSDADFRRHTRENYGF